MIGPQKGPCLYPFLVPKGPRHLTRFRHQGLPLSDAVSMLDMDSFFNLFFPLLAL